MKSWKRILVGVSAGAAAVMLGKGKTTAALILAGVSLATLASEYPEKFAEIREQLPAYVDRGSVFLDIILRAGERLAEAEGGRRTWYEALLGA
jgi:hypothetical protein